MNKKWFNRIILSICFIFPVVFLYYLDSTVWDNHLERGNNMPTLLKIETDIPIYSFKNQEGKTITNDYYKGKIYISNFGVTKCIH